MTRRDLIVTLTIYAIESVSILRDADCYVPMVSSDALGVVDVDEALFHFQSILRG